MLKISAYALLVIVLVLALFQFTTLGSDTVMGQILRDITPLAITLIALVAGVLLATLPEVHRRLNTLFKGPDSAAGLPQGEDSGQKQDQDQSQGQHQGISRETPQMPGRPRIHSTPLASVGQALPLRQPSPSLREPFPAQSAPGETARSGDSLEKTALHPYAPSVEADAEINVKPGHPSHHTDTVPVEDLFNGVINALGSGLGAIIDTGAATCKPVARAMQTGCKGAFEGAKSKLDALTK